MDRLSLWGKAGDVVSDSKHEQKWIDDVSGDPFNVPATPGYTDLLGVIPQGAGQSDRVGRLVNVSSVSCRGYWSLSDTSVAAGAGHACRFMIVVDTQANKTAWTVTQDLLQTDSPYSFHKLDKSARFVILHDELVTLNHTAGSWDGTDDQFAATIHPFSVEIADLCIPLTYSGADGTIDEITDNAIYTVFLADVTLKVNAHCVSRLRYSDG